MATGSNQQSGSELAIDDPAFIRAFDAADGHAFTQLRSGAPQQVLVKFTAPYAVADGLIVRDNNLALAHAADPAAEILIAYAMNGEPLGRDHGAPFRLIVPHWYAVASVKWLKRIDVLTEPYSGEFQTGHYMYEWPDRPHEAVTLMRVRARITDPAPGSAVGRGTHAVRGKAWSGTGPVTSVDVSLTGEGDWHPARLEPPQGPYHWQDWSFDWAADDIGRHTLRARATDAAGHTQPEVPPWNRLGYGNNAVEVIYIDVG